MDYLDHHSKLVSADLLGSFDAGTRVKIADCILLIAEDLHGAPPEAECALIAVAPDAARVVFEAEPDAHMLCVPRAELERTAHRMFPDDLAVRVVETVFPQPK